MYSYMPDNEFTGFFAVVKLRRMRKWVFFGPWRIWYTRELLTQDEEEARQEVELRNLMAQIMS